ncbi:MAG: TolC family protein, partial [Bacteroidales bacterium]
KSIQSDLIWDINNVFIGTVSLVQPIFMGGKIVAANQIANYAEKMALALKDKSLQDLIYSTDEIYWQVVSLANKRKLAESYVQMLQKMDTNTQALIEEGIATSSDGLAVKVKLNEARIALAKVENGLSLSRMLLCQLCGLPLESNIVLQDENLDKHIEVEAEKEHIVSSQVLEQAYENRKDLQALDYMQKIAKKKEAIILSDLLPNIGFTANYLISNPNFFKGFKKDFSGMFNVGVMLRVPITDWIGGSFRRQSSKSQTNIARLQYENAKEQTELQIKQSSFRANEAEKQIKTCFENRSNAEENLQHATYGFKEGVISSLNVMEAQTAWLSAQSALIDAQIEKKLAEAYFNKAIGNLNMDK